ncbi:hypothetical protein ACHWQZ_G013037 [Mnemiopsis leidyi]
MADIEEPEKRDSREKMKRNITVFRGIAFVVGTVMGTGIFITPNSITQRVNAPATSILVWLTGGVMAAIGGLVFCELGTMIPVSGAEVAYIRRIFGRQPAFLSVWLIHFLLGGMRLAIGALGFAQYFWSLFYEDPSQVNWWLDKAVTLTVSYLIVVLVTCKPTLILKSIVLFTAAKFTATFLIIGAGLYYLCKGHTENIGVGFQNTNTDPKDWGDAWNGVIWSYMGWEEICCVASEIQNPQKNIPIIVLGSISIITGLYLMTVISFHIVLPLEEMVESSAVASKFGEITMGESGKVLLALAVVVSTLGNLQCSFITNSRYIHSGAAEGLLPSCFGLVSKKFHTPLVSILYCCLVTTVFILIGGIDNLIGSASFTRFPFFVLCSAGVFVMRRSHPDLHRPYRVPLIFPALFICFGLFVFITPFLNESWLVSLVWVVVLLLGVPIYHITLGNVLNLQFLAKLNSSSTALFVRLFQCE